MPRNYIRDAEAMLNHADSELKTSKNTDDLSLLREISEKGYGAASDAVDGLTLRRMTKVCTSHNARQDCILELEELDKNLRNLNLDTYFSSVVEKLHIRCFHEADCSIPVIEAGLRDARKLVEAIRSII